MNKYILSLSLSLSLSLLVFVSSASAMDSGSSENAITLPSQEVLRKRLADEGFDYFMEKTKIDATLADKKLVPLGVGMAVELAMYDFAKYIKKDNTNQQAVRAILVAMSMSKGRLIKCLLKDYPQALNELKELGLLG
jgi:hypothetical protein